MAPKISFLVLLAVLLPAASSAAAFDIGKILSDYPEFSIFNSLLTQTGLARAINSREVVTVLAPNNTAVSGAFRGSPRRLLADLLALHVVLDYLDAAKLDLLRHGRTGDGSVVTTLLQGTGAARGRGSGFLRIATGENGRVTFSSAAPGGPRNATFERAVAALPYSVSVLQVSGLVFPPGIIPPQPSQRLPPRARHMSLPPSPAPAPGPEQQHPPFSGSGPLVPTPIRPVPTLNLTYAPPPPSGVIPIPSVHGGVAQTLPSAAGHRVTRWWSGAGVALGIMACLLGSSK